MSHEEGVTTSGDRMVLLLSLGTAVLLCLSITRESLWIDEAATASFAAQSSLKHLIEAMATTKFSDAQTPFYILYIWAWAKIFGSGEYALRASNAPLALMFTAALGWTSYHVFRRPLLWVVFCLSPFVVFYMNEARSYVAVIACAAVCTGAMLTYFSDRERYGAVAPWVCSLTLVIACGVSMLGAFLVPSLVIYAVLTIREKKLDPRAVLSDWTKPLLVSLPLLLVVAGYDAWTVLAGAGGKKGNPGLGNIAFAAWEFMGLAGLGPPRNELRAAPSVHTVAPYWPWLTMGILACAGALGTIPARLFAHQQYRASWSLPLALFAGIALLLVAASVVHFEFRGRHLAIFFPGLVFAVISLTSEVSAPGWLRTLDRAAFTALAIAWLISDARIVGLPQYYKDDYRFAASFALNEATRRGGTVLWAADSIGGRYYGVDLNESKPVVDWPVRGKGVYARNWTDRQVNEYMASHAGNAETILVLSKLDLYDTQGAWTAAIQRMHARKIAAANSFDIYAF